MKPTVFEITAPNGKTYEIEANEGVSEQEALAQFQALSESEWSAYEAKTSQTSAKAPTVSKTAAVPQTPRGTVQIIPETTELPKIDPQIGDYQLGGDSASFAPTNTNLSKIDERQLLALINNPNVTRDQVNQFLSNKGRQYGDAEWQQIEAVRRKGQGFGAVAGADEIFEGMVDKEALAAEYTPESDGFFAQVGRSIVEAYSDPASIMNAIDRGKLDFFDVYQDELRKNFPDATPEQLDQLEEQYIGYMARLRSQAASEGVANDSFVPWLIGQFAALEPTDAFIPARAARAGTKVGRAFEKGVEGAVIGAGTDLVGQGLAIADQAQDEFDPLRTAASAALSGAFGGAAQGAEDVAKRMINGPEPQSFERGERIVVPTARGNSKKYRYELGKAASVVQQRADELTSTWTNAPAEVKALPNFKNEADIDDDAIGVYTADGRVLLNTEAIIANAKRRNITPEQMVESVVFHEALGHHGLTQQFGDELDLMLDTIYTEGKAEFRDKVDQWIARNPDAYPSPTNAAAIDPVWQRIRATEEVLAEMSEKGLVDRTMMDRIVDLIKRFAREVGLDKLVQRIDSDIGKYSTREVRGILAVSQRNVMSGDPTGATPGSVKNKIVYHGSGADFNKFDHSKMGTGEGQQIFGWGTYLTDVENIAKSYKEKLSRQDVSFGGRRGPIWQLRDMANNRAEELGLDSGAVDAAFTIKSQYYPNKEITGETVYHDYMATVEDPDWSQMSQQFRDEMDAAAKFVNDNYKVEYSGKTYEVDIPDDAKWLEWEQPLSEQPELRQALEAEGLRILSRDEVTQIRSRIKEVLKELKDPDLTAARERELDTEFDKLDNLLKPSSFKESDNGELVYSRLTEALGSAAEASKWLADNGFTGNRYLANNISRRRSRQGEDKDKFNYVVFDDNVPKIVNKYMKPSKDNEGDIDTYYASTDKTFSAGFKRPQFNSRSAAEARKQFWKNKLDPDWDPNDPNGIPSKVSSADRYMRGSSPIDPDQLSADDIIYSQDAMGLLDRVLDNYNPTAVDIAGIEQSFIDRGVKPSDVARLSKMNPGDLVKRRMRYDIAAMKINDRVLAIEEDIRTNGLTEEKQLEFIKADQTLRELSAAIFDMDSEFGRALNQLKKMALTRRKAQNLREFLKEYDLGEAIADPETFQNYMAMRASSIKADKETAGNGNPVYQVLGVPRALMSSFDLSAPMRQGITFIGTKEYWKSFFKMFTFIGPSGKENYNWLMKSISRSPNYELMLKARLSFSELDGKLSQREEDFQTDLARKIPGIGLGVRMSEQAYAGFLNKLRADMFNKMVEFIRKPDGSVSDKALADLGKFINSATGRAELPRDFGKVTVKGRELSPGLNLQSSAPLLNAMFFSPRLIQSRLNMLNPRFYMQMDSRVRNAAMLEMLKMGGLVTAATFALTAMTPEAEVEWDPRSSDFGKVKVGDTRFDLGGGYNQYLTFFARAYLWTQNLVTGPAFGYYVPEVKSTAGNERDLDGRGRYGQTFGDIFLRFFRGKLSPNASYVADAFAGESVVGEPFTVGGSALERFLPMTVSALMDNVEAYGAEKGIRYSAPNVFGIGTSTFPDPERNPNQRFEAPNTFKGMELDRAAKEWWEDSRNGQFKALVEIYAAETGFEWKDIPEEVQAQIIAKAKEDSLRYVREDAEEELMETE